MNKTSFLHISFLLHAITTACAAKESQPDDTEKNSIEDLLRPMKGLQIIIRLDDRYDSSPSAAEALELPLQFTLDFLQHNLVPFQIVSHEMRKPTLDFAPRHVHNQVSWLLFLSTSQSGTQIPMMFIIESCYYWSNKAVWFVLEKHLINVLVLNSRTPSDVQGRFDLFLYRECTPFYLVVFNWITPLRKFVRNVWAYDVGFEKTRQRIIEMPWYFTMAAQEGIEAVVQNVSRTRKDFHGDRIQIYPEISWSMVWHSWEEQCAVQLRHLQTPGDVERAYMGLVLMTFARKHNFTFDTVGDWKGEDTELGFIHMLVSTFCVHYCEGLILSLNTYAYYSTLMTADLVFTPAFMLSSTRLPADLPAVLILLSLTVFAALLFNKGKIRPGLADTFFLSISSFCLQASSVKGKVYRWFYIPWLLFGTYIALYYATVLQSYSVNPDTYFSELSFEETVRQKFRFVSTDALNLQEAGRMRSKLLNEGALTGPGLSFLRREVTMGEKVRLACFQETDPDMILHLLESNTKIRKAFIGSEPQLAMFESILKAVGRNAIKGKERFIWQPYFWRFAGEKRTALAHTLEVMKAGGLVDTFVRKAKAGHSRLVTSDAERAINSAEGEGTQNDLSDNLFPESFFLFLYVMTLSVIGAALEPAVAALSRKVASGQDT